MFLRGSVALLPLFLALSCGPPMYLVTDPLFRAAAPEVVEQWAALRPFRNAQSIELSVSDQEALARLLQSLPQESGILVGVAIPAEQRQKFSAQDPRLVFLSVPTPGVRTIGVDRGRAWALVAEKALSAGGDDPGWVIFPADVTPEERRNFSDVWSKSGRDLVEWVAAQPGDPAPGVGPVFQWAGEPANPLVADLSSQRVVHGNPGSGGPPGSQGFTWKISTRGLGDFLWKTVKSPHQQVTFLPLETVLTSR